MFYTSKQDGLGFKSTVFFGLKPKDRKHRGQNHTYTAETKQDMYRFNAIVEHDGSRITLAGVDFHGQAYTKIFKVGDIATYDSWNLIYTGEIVKITDKAVHIVKNKGHKYNEKTMRLDLYQFASQNWDFDADKAAKHNSEEMMYL